jgi:hypothetical protein
MLEKLQDTITDVAGKGEYAVEKHIPGRGRYEYAVLVKNGRRFFIKAGVNQQEDYDEPVLLHNLQREVWWAQTVATLAQERSLPFASPVVIETNIESNDSANEDIGWIIFEYEEAKPISGGSIWDTGKVDKDWRPEQVERFTDLIPNLCATLDTLHSITPTTFSELGVPQKPPHKPHGEVVVPDEFIEVIRQDNLLDHTLLERALAHPKPQSLPDVLGPGDFEVGHLMIRDDGTVIISDNEFAGWYPKYDSLTYCLHRLWATRRQPELAKALLGYFLEHYVPQSNQDQFWIDFSAIMVPRLVRGIYYDASRRTLPTGHENQELRRELLKTLLDKHFNTLT